MKATSASPKNAGGTNAAASSVAARRPAARGTASASNRFERQARRIETDFLAGKRGLHRLLSPTAAAGFRLPDSRGEPLEAALRATYENAFAADLAAIRIHRDSAAFGAVRDENARAFVSGRDIYFGAGEYAPHRRSGAALLAHEIAHVLQQTGRVGSDGRLHATLVAANAEIQHAPDDSIPSIESILEKAKKMQPVDDIRKAARAIADAYSAGVSDDAVLTAECGRISALSLGSAEEDFAPAVLARTKAADFPSDANAVLRLYFDVLKAAGRPREAVALVGGKIPATTAQPLFSFYQRFLQGDFKWLTPLLRSHKIAGQYWKRSFIESYRIIFYGLTRVVQDLDPKGDANKKIATAFDEAMAATITPNEREPIALLALLQFNMLRVTMVQSAGKPIMGAKSLLPLASNRIDLIRKHAAGGLLQEAAMKVGASPEVAALADEIDPDITEVAKSAVTFWDQVKMFVDSLKRPDATNPFPDLDQLRLIDERRDVLPARISKIKGLAGLEKRLVTVATTAFHLAPGGKFPSAAVYRANLTEARKALSNAVFAIDQGLIALARRQDSEQSVAETNDAVSEKKQSDDVPDIIVYGAVLSQLFWLSEQFASLEGESASRKPGEKPDDAARRSGEDQAIRHRVKSAEQILGLAILLGYKELGDAAKRVLLGQQVGQQQSYVALLGSFGEDVQKDTLALLEKFQREFPPGATRHYGITGTDIVHFTVQLFYAGLAHRIADVLAAPTASGQTREQTHDAPKPVVNEAIETLVAFSPPRRYVMPKDDVVLLIRQGGDGNNDTARVDEFVPMDHPAIKVLRDTALKKGEEGYIPGNLSAHADGFVIWVVPDFTGLANELARVPGLTAARRKNGKVLGEPDAEHLGAWFAGVKEIVDDNEEWQKTIADAIRTEMETEWTRLAVQLRRATTNDRRTRLLNIISIWDKFKTDDLGAYLNSFTVPNQAIRQMQLFASGVQPASDQKLQFSALLLELAPKLMEKLGPQKVFTEYIKTGGTDRLDIILGLVPHMNGAARFIREPGIVDELKTLDLAFDAGEILTRVGTLEALAAQFSGTLAAVQKQSVFGGSAARNELFVPDRGYPVIANDPTGQGHFTVDGVTYTLVKVYQDFTFNPAVAIGPTAIPWPADKVGKSKIFDAEGVEYAPTGAVLLEIKREISGVEKTITVKDTDDAVLSELAYAVQMNVILRQLGDLGTVINEFGGWVTLGLQIAFPEFAAEIGYAEILGTILQFLASPEFEEIRASLDGDLGGLFEGFVKKMQDKLNLEALWNYMLFDELPFAVPVALSGLLQTTGRQKRLEEQGVPETASGVRRVLNAIIRAGEGIGHAVVSLQHEVSFPVRKAEVFVSGSPWISLILRVIARNLYRLETLNMRDLGDDLGIGVAQNVISRVEELYDYFEKMLGSAAALELPQELVPLNDLVYLVLNFIVDRLPTKYRVPMRTLRKVDKIEQLWRKLADVVASELKKANLDPNRIWQASIRSALEPYFELAVKSVADEVNGIFNKVPFLKGLRDLKHDAAKLLFSEHDFPDTPEVQPKLESGNTQPSHSRSDLRFVGGRPLTTSERVRIARGFGHDFSHVRLHRDAAADRATASVGAKALTSGSHVFLSRSVDPASESGGAVVRHEFVHVLQQGGPRPLHGSHSATPVKGRPNRGVHFDSSRERQADQIARATQQSVADRAIAIDSGGELGVQPSLFSIVGKFFGDLGDPTKIREHVETVEKRTIDTKGLDEAAPDLKGKLGDRFKEALKARDAKVVKFASLFDAPKIQEMVINHLLTNRREELENEKFDKLMSAAIETKTKKQKKGDSNDQETVETKTLRPGRLEVEIEEFVFGVSGVAVDIEFNLESKKDPAGKETRSIVVDKPFAEIKFNYLHLPMLGPTHSLWKEAIIPNTFGNVPQDKLQAYAAKARLALQGLKPGPGIYQKKKVGGDTVLALSKKVIELTELYLAPKKTVAGNDAPKWSEYAKTDPQTATANGQLGLRLGLYKEKDDPGKQLGADRDSHHTVQFLLIEYLHNDKGGQQPFRHNLALYPNVEGKGAVERILPNAGASDGINVSANYPGRGGPMPTILLSKHAHIYGDVHVSAKPDDLPDKPPSQGAAVHGEFKRFLGPYADIVTGAKDTTLRAIQAREQGKTPPSGEILVNSQPVTSAQLSTRIFDASCQTYTWMRDMMRDKLRHALQNEEREYYESLVQTATDTAIYNSGKPQPGYVFDSSSVDAVMKAVIGKQTSILEGATFGFKEKKP